MSAENEEKKGTGEQAREKRDGWMAGLVKSRKKDYADLFSAVKSNFASVKNIAEVMDGNEDGLQNSTINQSYYSFVLKINAAAMAVILILSICSAIIHFVGIAHVDGESMETTLADGRDIFLLRTKAVTRGDIAVFNHYYEEDDTDEVYVKRVIAIGGDTISCEDGTVYVNGEAIEEPYVTGVTDDFAEVTVGDGELYVMGDNREFSYDSRWFGVIDAADVLGRAFRR